MLATAVIHYQAAAATDRGRKRASNEDSFGFSAEHGLFVVCDGMGGAAAGEIASSLAVDEMMRQLGEGAQGRGRKTAEQAVAAANSSIYSRSRRSARLSGMGTTLVALLAEEGRVFVLNVGDSRCYRLRSGHLEQVTLDHSLVDEQVRMGRLTQEEALRSPLRNIITRALGTQATVTPDVFEMEAEPGDLFLLCSDGLTREVDDPQLAQLLGQEKPLEELTDLLITAANKAGGHDNITCILVRAQGEA
jgi:protein phosphatase